MRRTNAAGLFVDFSQAVLEEDFDAGIGDPLLEDLLGNVGLEGPLLVFAVVLSDLAIEVAADAADRGFVSGIGEAKASGGHATEMAAGFDEDDRTLQARGGDGCDHARRGCAVDAEIGLH